MNTQNLLIFSSGGATGGGSGFENLVNASQSGILAANIVGVVSNHENGGVRERADRLGVPFIHFVGPYTAEAYQKLVSDTKADFVSLSGWLKLVTGLDPKTTFNIHPGPLPKFGGKGMYGHYVHEAVMEAYKRGEVAHSAVSMHFVTEKYDEGPLFCSYAVEISPEDTAESLGTKVNKAEHLVQPILTNMIVTKQITWDGVNPETLTYPADYKIHQ